MPRWDGRSDLATRPITLQLNALTDVIGSIRYNCGQTSVIATVRGPAESTNSRRAFIDGACIRVSVEADTAENEGTAAKRYMETMGRTIEHLLYSLIKVEDYPSTIINFVLVIINDDGALMACLVNAAVSVALYSGLPFKKVALATCVGMASDDDSTTNDPGFLVDPSKDELCHSSTFVCDFHSMGVLLFLPAEGIPIKVSDYEKLHSLMVSHAFPSIKESIKQTLEGFAERLTAIIETNNY